MMVAHKLRPHPSPLLHAVVAVAAIIVVVAAAAGRELESSTWWCGTTSDDASASCLQSCPLGYGCADGTYCFSVATACAEDDSAFAVTVTVPPTTYLAATTTTSAATAGYSSSSSLGGLTGAAAVDETFLAMKTAIDERLFLYETPLMEWVPSTVYRFDGFFSGMQIMYMEGVAGDKLYMGGECDHCHMYGLVNVAAFLAQAMKETIRYVSNTVAFLSTFTCRVSVDAFVCRRVALTPLAIYTFRFIICLLGHLNFRMRAMKTRGIGWETS
jgi:hypothetical protein